MSCECLEAVGAVLAPYDVDLKPHHVNSFNSTSIRRQHGAHCAEDPKAALSCPAARKMAVHEPEPGLFQLPTLHLPYDDCRSPLISPLLPTDSERPRRLLLKVRQGLSQPMGGELLALIEEACDALSASGQEVPSSRLTRRPPSPAAAARGHPCHTHGPAHFPSS